MNACLVNLCYISSMLSTVIFPVLILGDKTTSNVQHHPLPSKHPEEYVLDPFHPSFMDVGHHKTGYQPPPDQNNCFEDTTNDTHCDSFTPYRTYDGSCNNLAHPTWGQYDDCHKRLLEAYYEGEYGIRQSVQGGPLPAPRNLTLKMLSDRDKPSATLTLLFTIFGQMLVHDITRIPKMPFPSHTCCFPENAHNTSKCLPYYQTHDDPCYPNHNLTCVDIHRSTTCSNCNKGKRQQPNVVTAALDGSAIYGSNISTAMFLRTLDGTGKLASEKTTHGELLPRALKNSYTAKFCPEEEKKNCFETGDGRVNQHSALMSTQTVFMREHNRIASTLKELNPHWDDETIYQEARKIVGAELQNIVYSEYLPTLLGPSHTAYYNLSVYPNNIQKNAENPSASGQGSIGTQYNPDIRLGIWNEFATGVFRLHSMIPNQVGMDHHRFRDYYSNPGLLREGKVDRILQGTCKVPSEKNDHRFVKEVSCHLFHDKYHPYGFDLVSLDIQRGRDHGMPPYVDMLRYLTNGKMDVTKFEDLSPIMPRSQIRHLKKNYKDVRDIDLFAGAVMEHHVRDSNLGPTACALVAMQFYDLKYGDRFYFEHEGGASSFTPAQRGTLKNSSLSRILCDNTDIRAIQRNAMLLQSSRNPLLYCEQIPEIDLTLWKISEKTNN